MPSYKSQIKGDKKKQYTDLYNHLLTDSLHSVFSYQYFYNLAQLVFPLKDNHVAFYQIPDYKHFKDQETINQFIQTKEFKQYPNLSLNIDSLKQILAQKPLDSIEGIYYYDTVYSVGLFRYKLKEYVGVILDSKVNLWEKGQIAIHLYKYEPNQYKAIYGHPVHKNFILQPNEKYVNQTLVNSYFYSSYSQKTYSKLLNDQDYVNLSKESPKYILKNVSHNTQYLLIKSFQGNHTNQQSLNQFYQSIKDSLTAPHLILDLRNNEGGSRKMSEPYLKLMKEYSKKGHIYILTNNGTLSQAEIFILRLKKIKNLTLVGQTTKGMLTYGSNYDARRKLPSGYYEIYITDMGGRDEYLKYEDIGIQPNILLTSNTDWIIQTLQIIAKKTP
ncbi:MAG: S41 family peptidase [Raineya sp.]|nr:S41 family peptidase [Raineya sp.]